ncbi:MAG: M48 family metallopeptidase [Chloroflexi bacterium]|nr:M48 family metallopeptidase [Chloroflexota bacterium]
MQLNYSIMRPARGKPTVLGTHTIVLGDRAVSYVVKRSPRAKYVRLQVGVRSGLTVVIPPSYDIDAVAGLLNKKKRWILDNLTKYVPRGKAPENGLGSGDFIPYLGRPLSVNVKHSPGVADGVTLQNDKVFVSLDSGSAPLNLVVEWWYREQAEKVIRKMVDELSSRMGVTCGRLTIRAAKTRWGSCSRKGNLNFNWRLVMAPESVINYVVIHELAHLREMNHSRKFWEIVTAFCPEWREHRQWLKDHERDLISRLSPWNKPRT